MESKLPTSINQNSGSQDNQVTESIIMEVEDEDIPDLVEIHQTPRNADPSLASSSILHNQEEVAVPMPITPGLDGEPASEYWSELDESDSEVNAESEYQEQIAGESDIEENEVRATTINVIRIQLPEEIFRALNNPVTRDFVLNALLSVVLPFPQAEMGTGDTEPITGMSQEEKDAISLVTIDGGPAEFEGQRTCSVCMEDFVVGELARKPRCSHLFHQTCLWPWLDVNRTCPSCRYLL